MFAQHKKHPFRHTFIYVDEHKERIDGIRRRAQHEAGRGEYRASRLRGFLTDRKSSGRISSAAALFFIVLMALLWYFIVY